MESQNRGLYRESFEHDNCGIGAIVNIKGKKTHSTVAGALSIVEQLEHRAGKDAEGKTGDGVGILTQIPHGFFKKVCQPLGIKLKDERDYGVGMFFLPQDELKRLAYRMEWEDAFLSYLKGLEQEKPVIFCGDLNVAATEMDIKNAKANEKNAGFTKEEREKFAVIKEKGFVDSFRMLYPDTVTYSWWSYRFQARQRNAGWRLDYFMVSESLKDAVADAKIHTEILGSDHCPVELDLEV